MNSQGISTITGLMLLTGCANDYTPQASDTGASIFQTACAECHRAKDTNAPNYFFKLDAKNANPKYIAFKVNGGSLMMPKFPHIKGKDMRALSTYVLDHSLTK